NPNDFLGCSCRTPAPPAPGGLVSIEAVNVTETVASTKIRMFMMMSKKGTMFSSPPSSSGASSRGCAARRILARCAADSFSDISYLRTRAELALLLDGQQIESTLHDLLEVVLDGLDSGVQDDVRNHTEHRYPEAQRGI